MVLRLIATFAHLFQSCTFLITPVLVATRRNFIKAGTFGVFSTKERILIGTWTLDLYDNHEYWYWQQYVVIVVLVLYFSTSCTILYLFHISVILSLYYSTWQSSFPLTSMYIIMTQHKKIQRYLQNLRRTLLTMDTVSPFHRNYNAYSGSQPNTDKSAGEMTLLPSTFILGANDVLCGRGKNCFRHVGNRKFRKLVQDCLGYYTRVPTQAEKTLIIRAIISVVRAKSQVGGFVKHDPLTGRYYEIGDKLAVSYIRLSCNRCIV